LNADWLLVYQVLFPFQFSGQSCCSWPSK